MQKKKIIADALIRIANLPPPDFEIIKSEKELRYRNRIQVHYHQQSVGYHRKGSNRLVAIDDCLIADERLINLFESLRDKNVRTQKRAELRLVDGQPALFSSEKEAGFLQVNPNQNQNMIEFVHDLIQDLIQQQKVKSFLDLYCGAGNFSLKIAENFPHLPVTGIDNNAAAIQKAKKLAQSQDTGNLRFVREDSLSYISKTTTLDGSLALIDPTRKGCDEQLLKLVSHKDSRALIYVSCNPATWARDIKRLREFDSRWKLTKLTAFDMFPQTPHVEIVSLLSREL